MVVKWCPEGSVAIWSSFSTLVCIILFTELLPLIHGHRLGYEHSLTSFTFMLSCLFNTTAGHSIHILADVSSIQLSICLPNMWKRPGDVWTLQTTNYSPQIQSVFLINTKGDAWIGSPVGPPPVGGGVQCFVDQVVVKCGGLYGLDTQSH